MTAYAPPKRAFWVLAIVPIGLAVVGLLLQFTDLKLSDFTGGSDSWTPCADRLDDRQTSAAAPTRMSPPVLQEVLYEQSQVIPGHVVVHVRWEATDRRTTMGQIHISGRRGTPDTNDFQVPLQYEPPQQGQCGTWYRSYYSATPGQWAWFETFDGLWGNETYCFSVNASDPNGGRKLANGHLSLPTPSYHTRPKCVVTKWKAGWGKPANPTK